MNDLDYLYGKIASMRGLSGKIISFVDSGYSVVQLESGLTSGTRDSHTLTNASPARNKEMILVIKTFAESSDSMAIVKVGFNTDASLANSTAEYLQDSYYENFKWFNMIPMGNNSYYIRINESIGKYLRSGITNNIHFVYRVFSLNGIEYRHKNPYYLDSSNNSYWNIRVNKLSLSGSYYPSNFGRLVEGFNELRPTVTNLGYRDIAITLNQNSISIEDDTDWKGSYTSYVNVYPVVSQFENVILSVSLASYWTDLYDVMTVIAHITDPNNDEYNVFIRPEFSRGKYIFNLRDIMNDFSIGSVNNTLELSFSIIPELSGTIQQEVDVSGSATLKLLETPDEFEKSEMINMFNQLSLY